MNDYLLFKNAITKGKKYMFNKINKNEFHNHGILGTNRYFFKKNFPNWNLTHFKRSSDIISLSLYIKNNLIEITKTKEGQLSLLEATIQTAISDGINTLDISVDYRSAIDFYHMNIDDYLRDLIVLQKKYLSQIIVNYDLGISRNKYDKKHYHFIISLIRSKVFNGIDLYGDELSQKITVFKKIFRQAEAQNMVLKAHVGEFGTAKDVLKAIKKLHLNMVQHGISIVNSQKAMKYAKKKGIIFNVCPTSNIMLNRVDKIEHHPIKEMYLFGLIITINTDDQLLFESSLLMSFVYFINIKYYRLNN